MKTAVALLWRGARAKRALQAARTDLAAGSLEAAVSLRVARPVASRRCPLALRAFSRALSAVFARQGETGPCLPRALALLEEARACGFAPALVLGVRRGAGGVESHAWLALDGAPFLEDPATPARYEQIATLPSSPARPAP